jgi:hypothetical protein
MQGFIKKIKGIFPVTTSKAVYVDGTNQTLQDILDSKWSGVSVTTTGRGMCTFHLRGGVVYVREAIANSSKSNKLKYWFPTGDYDRYRRMFVKTINGGYNNTLDLADGELENRYGLVYNMTTNTVEVRHDQWGAITCSANEYILLLNIDGKLTGVLAPYVDYGTDNTGFPIKTIEAEEVDTRGTTQGIIVINGTVYTCYHATDDHSAFDGKIGNLSHNICHMNAPEYNATKDALIVGNGSKSSTLAMEGWIFPGWAAVMAAGGQLDINTLDKITLTFPADVFPGEYKAQLCWAEPSGDNVFFATSDNRYIHKLLLHKGDSQGAYGTLVQRDDGGYNGTYDLVGTWYSRTTDIIGGMCYYKGAVYFGVKGSYGIRKCILKSDGYFDSEYIYINGKIGDMQGIAIYNDEVYAYSDSRGWKFSLVEL